MRKELLSFGFNMDVTTKVKNVETSIRSAFMKMNTIELYLAIGEETKAKKLIHNEKIQIKLEVDINPPPRARFENHLVLNPVTFYVLTLRKSDSFAGKMSAILFRAWKGRVKGRDWYDLIWYIQNKTPLSLPYLEECMRQAGNLATGESLDHHRLIEMLNAKIQYIDFESAKEDMRPFISDPEKLEVWSSKFFSALVNHLLIE